MNFLVAKVALLFAFPVETCFWRKFKNILKNKLKLIKDINKIIILKFTTKLKLKSKPKKIKQENKIL